MQDKIRLSDETIKILKNFSRINEGIKIKAGSRIRTITHPKTTIVATAVIPDVFPVDFAIHALPRLFGALSLFKEPEIQFMDRFLTISAGGKKLNYTYSDAITIPGSEKDYVFPAPDVVFTLQADALQGIIKASGTLGMPHVQFSGEPDRVEVVNLDKPTADLFSIDLGTPARGGKNYKIVFDVENLIALLPGDYEVAVSFKKIIRFKRISDGGIVEYMVAPRDCSTVS